jgi:hypothetical protein
VVGVIGSLIGGWLFSLLGIAAGGLIGSNHRGSRGRDHSDSHCPADQTSATASLPASISNTTACGSFNETDTAMQNKIKELLLVSTLFAGQSRITGSGQRGRASKNTKGSTQSGVLQMKSHVLLTGTGAALVLLLPTTIFGQVGGTAAEAKAMLLKAVAVVKADKAKALDQQRRRRLSGSRCVNIGDSKFVAIGSPNAKYLLGKDATTFKDIDGDHMGIVAAAHKPEGEITTIDYQFPKPGADKTPVPKQILITKVDGLA